VEAEWHFGGQVSWPTRPRPCRAEHFFASAEADHDPSSDSGAWFLAASKEHDVQNNHNIVADGYNLGRDYVRRRC
jgi:deoxyribodipyrimidine photolyase